MKTRYTNNYKLMMCMQRLFAGSRTVVKKLSKKACVNTRAFFM